MKISAIQDTLIKYMIPIADKVAKNRYLSAIKDGMVASIPINIIGSFSTLPVALKNLIPTGPIHDFFVALIPICSYAGKYTTNLLSIYVALFVAIALAKQYKINNTQTGVTAIVVHMILCGISIEGGIGLDYLGASGLFTSIISGIFSVEVTRFFRDKGIVIKMPESVPPMVSESFASLIPIIVNVVIAIAVATLSQAIGGAVFPALVMSVLAPAINTMDTLPALLVIMFLTQFLWFFGLHGPSITSAVRSPFAVAYGTENIAAYAAGESVNHIFTNGLYFNVLQVTGSGLTIGLVLLMMRSKLKSYRAVGKAAIVPSLFGINEPVIFGIPIILNPFMFIPFVFGPLVVTTLTYVCMASGIVMKPIANPPGFLPPGVGAFLLTFDWKCVVLVFINLIIMALIYYPFFKVMEADELKKEQAVEV